jgi:hypothetical protein
MSVASAFKKAGDEVKKVVKTRKLSPSLANAFIALIITIFHYVKVLFFRTYDFIFTQLNKVLPLPFASQFTKPATASKTEKKTIVQKPKETETKKTKKE